ncbi:MAG: cytochrome C [Sulfurimonas sp. GWF2_37_8]|nr:MAG: cytochrome C [Sulfurimonas sp. GWF2_37_8]
MAPEETIKETVTQIKESVANVSGADLFKACASCHGQKGEKPALGKSQIITGWSATKVSAALHGYKDGTYGTAMKSVMKGQVSKLSDAQIQTLSDYISTL